MKDLVVRVGCVAVLCQGLLTPAAAQQVRPPANATAAGIVADPVLPLKFIIGVGDVLAVTFWRDERLSGDVVVRPDGRISLPLLNDVQAAGQTPEQLAGADVDIRSDLYSLGVTLWEMLAGQAPLRGSPTEAMYQHQRVPLPVEQLRGIPQPLVILL